jgi:hypothetical protein
VWDNAALASKARVNAFQHIADCASRPVQYPFGVANLPMTMSASLAPAHVRTKFIFALGAGTIGSEATAPPSMPCKRDADKF